jgi:hypothetical protein
MHFALRSTTIMEQAALVERMTLAIGSQEDTQLWRYHPLTRPSLKFSLASLRSARFRYSTYYQNSTSPSEYRPFTPFCEFHVDEPQVDLPQTG